MTDKVEYIDEKEVVQIHREPSLLGLLLFIVFLQIMGTFMTEVAVGAGTWERNECDVKTLKVSGEDFYCERLTLPWLLVYSGGDALSFVSIVLVVFMLFNFRYLLSKVRGL